MSDADTVIYRPDLMQRLGVCSETIRRYLKAKKLPPPDVALIAEGFGGGGHRNAAGFRVTRDHELARM